MTKYQILNLAASEAGQASLTSLEAGLKDNLFDMYLQDILETNPWPFGYVLLNENNFESSEGAEKYGYTYAYSIPQEGEEVIEILGVNINQTPTLDWSREDAMSVGYTLDPFYPYATQSYNTEFLYIPGDDTDRGKLYCNSPITSAVAKVNVDIDNTPMVFQRLMVLRMAAHFAKARKQDPVLANQLNSEYNKQYTRALRSIGTHSINHTDLLYAWVRKYYGIVESRR